MEGEAIKVVLIERKASGAGPVHTVVAQMRTKGIPKIKGGTAEAQTVVPQDAVVEVVISRIVAEVKVVEATMVNPTTEAARWAETEKYLSNRIAAPMTGKPAVITQG